MLLTRKDIPQLVADKLRSANLFANIPVRVTVNPVLSAASLDKVILVGDEGSVDAAPFEIGRRELE